MNIGGYDLWPADEPRFGEVAREMIQFDDYLMPRVNGEPYREKPPLLFWAIAAASWPFGDVTALSARIPSVLAGLATVLFTYLLTKRLYDRRTAWWAAVVLMTGFRFWHQARTVQIDMLLTACLTLVLLAFWCWHDTRRRRWLLLFYAAIAAGVYAKGPPAIVFPVLLVIAFYWKQKEERRKVHLVWGTVAVVAAIALWLIPARMAAGGGSQGAETAIAGNLFRQIIGRFFLGVSKAQWPWYYVAQTLPVDLLPWTLFAPWTIYWTWRRRKEGPAMRLLLAWTIPALTFFSICVGKRAIYILPLFPAFAILTARSVLDLMAGDRSVWRKRTAAAWGVSLLLFGALPFALLLTPYRDVWGRGFLILSPLRLRIRRGYAAGASRRTDCRALHVAIASHFAGIALLSALFILPALNPHKSARWICEPVRGLAQTGREFDLYSVGFSREEYIFYSKHFHEAVLTDLLPVEHPEGMTLLEMAKRQKRLRKAIEEAVAAVAIASFDKVTPDELQALERAVHDGRRRARR